MNRIAWQDNGLIITAYGCVLLISLVVVETLLQRVHYQEPILYFDIQSAADVDAEEDRDELTTLSANDELTAQSIVTAIVSEPDGEKNWQQLREQFLNHSESIWLKVVVSIERREYFETAENILLGLIEADSNSVDVLFQYARLASQIGQDEVAVKRYYELLAIHPNHQSSLINLSLLLPRLQRFEEGIEIQSRAIESTSGEKKAKSYSVRGSTFLDLQDYSAARSDFQKSIEYRPQHASTWRKLANAQLLNQEDDEAVLKSFNQSINLQAEYLLALHERGKFHWLRGQLADARTDFEKAKAVSPNYQPARWSLLHLYVELGKRRSAREEIKWHRKQRLSSWELTFVNGIEDYLKGDYKQAVNKFAQLDTETPDSLWHHFYLAMSASKIKKGPKFDPLPALQKMASSHWLEPLAQLATAEWLRNANEDEKAITVLQVLNTRHPKSHYYAYTLGKNYLDSGFNIEAASALQRAMQLDPEEMQTRLSLGIAYRRSGQMQLALKTYEDMLQINPDHRSGRYNYALLLNQLDRTEDAISQYQYLLQTDPSYVSAQYQLARLYEQTGNYEDALGLLVEVLAEEPTHYRGRELKAEVHWNQNNLDLALEEVNRLLVLDSDRVSAIVLKADVLSDLGELQAAVNFLLTIPDEKRNRNTAINLFNVGVRALNTGDLELAETSNREAIAIQPDYDKAWVNLSSALNRLGRFDETVMLLADKQELMKTNKKLTTNLAQAYQGLGNQQKVIALLEPLQQQNLLSEEGQLVLADSYKRQ